MYEAFYELTNTPFSRGIKTEDLYMPPELDEVLNRLNYVAERQLFAVVTGDCGTGKTTLLRKSWRRAGHPASLRLRRMPSHEPGDAGRNPVPSERQAGFGEPRWGSSLQARQNYGRKLQLQAYAAIRQRIDIQSTLNHYDRAQTGSYISHQLRAAGSGAEIFTDAAVDAIYHYSSGTARIIDKVCTSLLLYGSHEESALSMIMQSNMFWNASFLNDTGKPAGYIIQPAGFSAIDGQKLPLYLDRMRRQ